MLDESSTTPALALKPQTTRLRRNQNKDLDILRRNLAPVKKKAVSATD